MNLRATIVRIVLLLLVGATIGGIIGAIFTGDWIYTIVWCIGLPVFLTIAGFLGSRAAKQRVLTRPGSVPGIIHAGDQQSAPAEAVLNPEPTAVPVTDEPAPVPSRRTGTPFWNRALAILIVLLGIGLTLLPSYRMIGWTFGNLAQGRFDGNDMRTGLHQQEAVDDLARLIGTSQFVSVNFYDSYVIVEAPTHPDASTTDQFEWRYGRAERLGPYSGVIDGAFDASQIDFSIVGELVGEAKADAGWSDFTYFYPAVREYDGEVQITVSLGNDYYSASYTYSAEGELLDRYGTGLD